jgi:hypothetical protein
MTTRYVEVAIIEVDATLAFDIPWDIPQVRVYRGHSALRPLKWDICILKILYVMG